MIQRKTRPKKRNAKRAEREWLRAYGSKLRVDWVRQKACLVCYRASENAHIESGGKGRKADANKIVPLCHDHHTELHRIGRDTFEAKYHTNLADAAAALERQWRLAHQESAE